MIGGIIVLAVGIGFLLNWQVILHARNTLAPIDIHLGAGVTAASFALLLWLAISGLRLSAKAAPGLADAARTVNIVALIHLLFYAINAAAIYHSVW
jgi:hypothetical protein